MFKKAFKMVNGEETDFGAKNMSDLLFEVAFTLCP